MSKLKSYTYIVDSLSPEKGEIIKKALQKVPEIKSITVDVPGGIVGLFSSKDPETELKFATEIAGADLRIEIKKKRGLFS